MNILSQKIAAIEKHISTHSERSVEDIAAVTTLKDFFKYDGKIIPNFAEYDKWPNTEPLSLSRILILRGAQSKVFLYKLKGQRITQKIMAL